ncbi:MAG: PepSY domain-containing protein [Roseitalea porphyridii]|uniref:PepSY domain-containing protein n=1 Tax=Roseitalea porphyridii TaxID=1852022 RepID=UPI0032F03926
MKTTLIAASMIAVLSPAAAMASDECPNVPRDQWMSDAAITEKAKGMGYDVRSIEADDGCLEADAFDKDGKRVEVYFHPATGEVLEVSEDD